MSDATPNEIFDTGLETPAIRMVPYWRIRFLAPEEDVDRIFEAIIEIAPLEYGKTDRNATRAAPGFEYYRPLQGTPTGAESETRKRPGVTEMSVAIPPDRPLLERIITAIYETHSYYEPPISVEAILRSQTKGLDDSDNPNRWWNKAGDWKAK